MRWIGALLVCASSTILTICASAVSAPMREAWKRKLPVRFSVPPITAAPACLSTGIDSPVSIDSSTDEEPSSTTPSVAMRSPGRTTIVSPTISCSAGISTSSPPRSTWAVAGLRSSSLRTAAEECFLMISSMYLPSSTKAMITAETSK